MTVVDVAALGVSINAVAAVTSLSVAASTSDGSTECR